VGCYNSSPLKQNLIPGFLSVGVGGAETKLELGLNDCSSNSPVILWVASKTCLCQRGRSSSFSEVDGWRVDVAKSTLSKPCRDTFKVSRVKLPSMHEKILQELEGFQLAIELLESRGFSGRFHWLGVVASFQVAWWSLQILVLRLESRCWRRPLISSLRSSKEGRQGHLCFGPDRRVKSVYLVLYAS
jgi:hypothetical protein